MGIHFYTSGTLAWIDKQTVSGTPPGMEVVERRRKPKPMEAALERTRTTSREVLVSREGRSPERLYLQHVCVLFMLMWGNSEQLFRITIMTQADDPLTTLARFYGSDKAQHGFTGFYHQPLQSCRDDLAVVAEIGIRTGASLLMWRDYLPAADVLWN